MRAMKDSGIAWIGKIPSEWDIVPFRAYVNERVERNKGNKTDELLALSFALGVTLYKDKVYNKDRVKDDFEDYKIVHKNDLVLSPNDIIKGSIYVSQYYGCISPMYYIFESRYRETHNLYYLSYLLRTKEAGLRFFYIARGLIGSISDNGKYVTRRMTVSRQDLLTFKVLLPPIKEQYKIVTFLDSKCAEIDALSADIQSEIETLDAYKRSVITEAVTKGTKTRFKYIATICANLVNPAFYPEYHQIAPDSIEKNTGKIIIERTVDEAAVDSWNHLFYKGQLLYSKIRPVLNKVTIAPYDGLCSADMYPIETRQNIRFIKYVMLSPYFVEQVDIITRDRIKMPKINQEELGNIRIFIPTLEEQSQIADFLDAKCSEIDAIIAQKQEQLAVLAEYKKSVIYEYVTGKKEVPAV